MLWSHSPFLGPEPSKGLQDIFSNPDYDHTSVLLLLDLTSAAFDIVDHSNLLELLYQNYGKVLSWLRPYLSGTGRSQNVSFKNDLCAGRHRAPQGSGLGQLLSSLYLLLFGLL